LTQHNSVVSETWYNYDTRGKSNNETNHVELYNNGYFSVDKGIQTDAHLSNKTHIKSSLVFPRFLHKSTWKSRVM